MSAIVIYPPKPRYTASSQGCSSVAFSPSEKYQRRGIEVKTIAETLVTYVVAREVVDGSLGQHGVVLELTLAERRSVGSNEDQLGLAGTQGLDGGLVAESDWKGENNQRFGLRRQLKCHAPFPDCITRARRLEMVSPVFLLLGAIVTLFVRVERNFLT